MTQYEISRRAFMSRLGAAGGLLVSGGLLAACGSDDDGAAGGGGGQSGPLKLGYARPTTGPTASSFALLFTPADMAIEELNAKGGIDGHKIEKVDLDDKGDPAEEPGVFRKFKEQDVRFVVGPNSSGTTLGALPISTALKILNLSSAVADELGNAQKYPYTFQMNASAGQEARAVVEWCVKEKGYKRIAILYADDPFGQTLTDGSEKVIQELGAELVGKVAHESVATAMTPFLSSLKKNNPDVILQWQSVAPDDRGDDEVLREHGLEPAGRRALLAADADHARLGLRGDALQQVRLLPAQLHLGRGRGDRAEAEGLRGQAEVHGARPGRPGGRDRSSRPATTSCTRCRRRSPRPARSTTRPRSRRRWRASASGRARSGPTRSARRPTPCWTRSSMVIASAISGKDPKAETFFRERVSA